MVKTIILAMAIAMPSGSLQSVSPRVVTMQELTVPTERLPAGCALEPATSVPLEGHRVRGRSWAGLPITTNPWTGTDRPVVAAIRERMTGPTLAPDGPPLSAKELLRYRLQLADGVEEAYAAIYKQSEPDLIVVYASRLASTERPVDHPSATWASNSPELIRVAIGPIVAIVSGDGGQCFQAVGAYLKSLANERDRPE